MFLDRAISRKGRVILLAAICLIPAAYTVRQFSSPRGFSQMLLVGSHFYDNALPQFKKLSPSVTSYGGYDAQFYAQIALDPSLRDSHFESALDLPAYRARRILLPALSWVFGFGQPKAIVMAYVLLSIGFWYVMLGALIMFRRPRTHRDWLCIAAISLSSGALYSVARSLIDLPAATFLVLACELAGTWSLAALSAAILTKEFYAICCWVPLVNRSVGAVKARRIVVDLLIILGPAIAWAFYVLWRFGSITVDAGNFTWPFYSWLKCIVDAIARSRWFDVFAAISLLVQLSYLFLHPRIESFYWRVGVTFGVTAIFLSSYVLAGGPGFTRVLFPMTIAFNVLLMDENKRGFVSWFAAGNVGLFGGLVAMIVRIF